MIISVFFIANGLKTNKNTQESIPFSNEIINENQQLSKIDNKETHIDFEEVQVNADRNIFYTSAKELYEGSELIVIAEPINNISDEKPVLNYSRIPNGDKNGPNASNTNRNDTVMSSFWTNREMKVYKTLKGKLSGDTIKIKENAAFVEQSDGNKLFVLDEVSPMQKNCKYIIFIHISKNGDYCITGIDQGKFNIDGKDIFEKNKAKYIGKLKEEVLNLFNSEIKVVKTHANHITFKNISELTEYSDLIVIGEPINSILDEKPYLAYITPLKKL